MGLLDQLLGGALNPQGQDRGSPLGGLESLLGALGGSSRSGAGSGGGNLVATLLPIALMLLSNRGGGAGGGLGGLLQQFQAAGLGQQADSWVGTGANQPVSAEQLMQVLGQGRMSQLASQAGLSQEETNGGLAALLPELVDQVTPEGRLPDEGSFDDVIGGLRRQLGM